MRNAELSRNDHVPRSEATPSSWGVVFGLSLLVVGGSWIWHDRQQKAAEGQAAASWPCTLGKILSVVKVQRWVYWKYYTSVTQEVQVRFSYSVAGRHYEGTRIHPLYGPSGSSEPHESLEKLLQRGQQVRVYYNPKDPSRSTLAVGAYTRNIAEKIIIIE